MTKFWNLYNNYNNIKRHGDKGKRVTAVYGNFKGHLLSIKGKAWDNSTNGGQLHNLVQECFEHKIFYCNLRIFNIVCVSHVIRLIMNRYLLLVPLVILIYTFKYIIFQVNKFTILDIVTISI